MPKLSPREIRRKIQGIKNTRRITKAMKVVSAAKLRRAQELIFSSRPYSDNLYNMVNAVASHEGVKENPMFEVREIRRVDLIVISADRGLAGAFNSAVIKRAEELAKEHASLGRDVSLILIGRKAIQGLSKRGKQVVLKLEEVVKKEVNFEAVKQVGELLRDRFLKGNSDAAFTVGNELITRASFQPMVRKFLPLEPPESKEDFTYDFEGDLEDFLNRLIELYLNYQIYRALLESSAAEHLARMLAMDNATRNADQLIKTWTLIFNKARQESITSELIDITNAVEAMK
ncbi:MAG: ATP synthase F1 subunit gamma [Aquificaceae bacterium]|nr:ATP synthase F1 subunit gamma [Aquificaceae bacterium]MDW8236815.1 ATP synthase F1 subunit gamma [Aquificaceae bacterium]